MINVAHRDYVDQMIKPDLVGSVEASAMLGVPRVTFNRWAASGRIPIAVQTSGRTGVRLFNRGDIEEFAQARLKLANLANKVKGHHHRGRPGDGQTTIPMEGDLDPDSVATAI